MVPANIQQIWQHWNGMSQTKGLRFPAEIFAYFLRKKSLASPLSWWRFRLFHFEEQDLHSARFPWKLFQLLLSPIFLRFENQFHLEEGGIQVQKVLVMMFIRVIHWFQVGWFLEVRLPIFVFIKVSPAMYPRISKMKVVWDQWRSCEHSFSHFFFNLENRKKRTCKISVHWGS